MRIAWTDAKKKGFKISLLQELNLNVLLLATDLFYNVFADVKLICASWPTTVMSPCTSAL